MPWVRMRLNVAEFRLFARNSSVIYLPRGGVTEKVTVLWIWFLSLCLFLFRLKRDKARDVGYDLIRRWAKIR
ncbi:hypothetical protein LY76DRAFT_586950 [Colletotrichum caudatum]|nr:hypothetical protein LY76DRAFT_586950 [Colletotrichum caudatum]